MNIKRIWFAYWFVIRLDLSVYDCVLLLLVYSIFPAPDRIKSNRIESKLILLSFVFWSVDFEVIFCVCIDVVLAYLTYVPFLSLSRNSFFFFFFFNSYSNSDHMTRYWLQNFSVLPWRVPNMEIDIRDR